VRSVFLYTLALVGWAASGEIGAAASAQRAERTGAELYDAACAACHGSDGRGAPQSVVGFDTPLPDFTDCSFSTVEPDPDWQAIVHQGGPVRGFDRRMPAYGEALTADEIARVVDRVREFCLEPNWPRGDLNLPRPFFTEKAFPENEAVLTTGVSDGAVTNDFVYEHRVGRRGQYELVVPLDFVEGEAGGWSRGLGDLAVAYKHAVYDNFRRGSILSVGAEVIFPTGKEAVGLGHGFNIFEMFGTLSQVLPGDGFMHLHGGFELPIRATQASNEVFWRLAAGKTFAEDEGRGRAWSPMVELLAAREVLEGETVHWDVLPEVQVSLNTRQHILFNVGVRVPLNEREGRSSAFLMYLLWDWFDGGLLAGW
jgi:mono/diheme cytochrome c family protein